MGFLPANLRVIFLQSHGGLIDRRRDIAIRSRSEMEGQSRNLWSWLPYP